MNDRRENWATGGLVFAAVMMMMVGVFQAMQGIAAIARDRFFVVGTQYAYRVDTTAWGWIHLLLGVLVGLTGVFLLRGGGWARGVGIGLAALQALAQFFFLPYYPLWSMVIIAMDVFVIWALASAPDEAPID